MSSENSGCLAAIFGFRARPQSKTTFPYHLERAFLSPVEIAFYQTLQNIIGNNFVIFSKPSLKEFIGVLDSSDKSSFYRISQKHVDFLICDAKTFRPSFVVELDDSSHRQAHRIERDKFVDQLFTAINLPLIHIPVQQSYDNDQIKGIIKNALQVRDIRATAEVEKTISPSTNTPPLCPTHAVPMVLRTAKHGSKTGENFWGCPHYPSCHVIIKIT